ncbi:heterokaryon incompatibility protein-domain-containing protein [Collybia nuda]|uniref:Heterokaryon incompatibility protein-domain-containing protein n=1 Tax=Collybia nuda TaxID=64659 RepID=A0A9P5Y738_9AGAR|nr:heterokaryon incompatibility protein-domain-containing protein [Collybia nuda]
MRLLDTTTIKLLEFQSNIPVYAILSHVWESEEVTFPDIADLDKARNMHGFTKITGACEAAIRDGIKYIWIDTCCINKESSAELSEAINSMYAWYRNARICYAYLCDVPSEGDHEDPYSLFAMSRWFTRGWTLQELIAPLRVVFYGQDWVDIGTKATLQKTISAVTGIGTTAIVGGEYWNSFTLDDVPVAVRMSWAAGRTTTREEDIAYSLMGLFGVNMPLLYGEGRNAFIRLQYEIIKKSTDHSIFAWTTDDNEQRGILARSPSEFHNSGGIERITTREGDDKPAPYSITNKGLYIELPWVVIARDWEREILALLNCRFSGSGGSEHIAIMLSRTESEISSEYVRLNTMELQSLESKIGAGWKIKSPGKKTALYIADDYSMDARDPSGRTTILLKLEVPAKYGKLQYLQSEPEHCWEQIADMEWKYAEQSMEDSGQGAVLVFETPKRENRIAVIIGTREPEAMIWCDVLTDFKEEDAYDIYESYCGNYSGASRWARKKRFLDRASANLADDWTITVSSGTSDIASITGEKFLLSAQVELKKSPKYEALMPPLKRPDDRIGYIVVPPTPQYGFTVHTEKFQTNSSDAVWVERLGSFVLYTDGLYAEILPFINNGSNEEFCLLVGPDPDDGDQLYSRIEKIRPGDPTEVLGTKGTSNKVYTAALGRGRLVFVTIRRCKDESEHTNEAVSKASKAKKRLSLGWCFSG